MAETAFDPYAAIAEWYDLEHDAFTEDIAFYLALLTATTSGRARVLEIGAGTGRIAAGLALAGYEVWGVEPSSAMRARCARRLAALPERVARRVTMLAGDAVAPAIPAQMRFDYILFGLDTFAHLTREEDQLRALTALRPHLAPHGRVLIDLDLVGLRRLEETAGQIWHSGTWSAPDSARQVAHFVTAGATQSNHVIPLTHWYDVWEQTGPVCRTMTTLDLALLSAEEMGRLAQWANLTIETIYGDYESAPFTPGSARAIFVATSAAR